MKGLRSIIAGALCFALAMPVPAQAPPAGPAAAPSSAPSTDAKSFPQQELDQLLAPIALYPDALLAQVLMASTYPVEIVMAWPRRPRGQVAWHALHDNSIAPTGV